MSIECKMDGDMGDCQKDELDEFANDEEIFKPRKKRVSEFKTLPWPKQMYAIRSIWKVECIHILWLDQPSEIQEETSGGW